MDRINLSNIRQAYGNSVYNWKIHEVSAEKLNKCIFVVKIINIILVSAVLILLSIQVMPYETTQNQRLIIDISASFLSVLEIIFLVILLSFGFEEKAVQHKKTALNFRSIRDRYINLISDIMNEAINGENIIERRNALLSEFQTICNLAPQTSRKSYLVTRNRLKPYRKKSIIKSMALFVKYIFIDEKINEEDFTLNDDEIDLFLPEVLKIKNLKK